ncbi:uncharacterized protein F5147DRAFT_655259 [Suillus discolor]|uniref:Uncharacterized protein n=1 Tax=Suillus discolor TaxID=1912936 RepID=A0A9P7JRD0_9AGAM|nr:uncharacterized protein F5147DRAFT_655259 [Suillus discolor]KAG2101619.1 hypothetical protein F5147DRAFT_655259 [Suillus discolor]
MTVIGFNENVHMAMQNAGTSSRHVSKLTSRGPGFAYGHRLDLISGQATPTIDDTYESLWSTHACRCRTGFGDIEGAHILKRAVGVFTDRADTMAATWNTIRHYSGMFEETIQNMEKLVNDSSNSMVLGHNIHNNLS